METVSIDSISPVFRNPLTDVGAAVINHQLFGECANFELKTMECFEAYGLDRGNRKCKDLIADLRECAFKDKQIQRAELMLQERLRKEKEGLLPPRTSANDPPMNSY